MKDVNKLPIKLIYNFAYRLSGNTEVAESLTEKVLLMGTDNYNDIFLLKQAWADYLKHYRCLDFQGKDPIQQLLLSLSPESRCAIILRDILSYSYGQIATVLSKSDLEVGHLISMGRQEITEYSKKTNIIS